MKDILRRLWEKWNQLSLVKQILCGIILGLILALSLPKLPVIPLFGLLFVGALKSVAPLLVFFLVMDSLAQHKSNTPTNIKSIIVLYCVSMLLAALAAVFITMTFTPTLVLQGVEETNSAPGNIGEVLHSVFTSFVQNPVEAITNANYIGILFWAVIFGMILRSASETTKTVLHDTANVVSKVIGFVIRFAPLGVFGLLYKAISDGGLHSLLVYGKLIAVLVGIMLFTALILNPLIVFFTISGNPYPLVWKCLRDSGVTAFFTRSSAANIPVNMAICEELKLDRATYSVSIPLGATINMCGGYHQRRPHVHHGHSQRLRQFRRSRRFAAAHSPGLRHVRHFQRHSHAGGRHGVHHRRNSGLLRNRAQFLFGPALHRCRRSSP